MTVCPGSKVELLGMSPRLTGGPGSAGFELWVLKVVKVAVMARLVKTKPTGRISRLSLKVFV
jgi:hypothetical protein